MTTALQFIAAIAALSASGDGRIITKDEVIDAGFEHDTGDSLDTLDQIIQGARRLLGQQHDERASVFVEERTSPMIGTIPDATDLQSAMQWLLDDMHDAGETHFSETVPFDSVENAARALINAGGVLNWYNPTERLPVIDATGTEVIGYAYTTDEAKTVAYDKGAPSVNRIDRRPITVYPSGGDNVTDSFDLKEAFVVIAD